MSIALSVYGSYPNISLTSSSILDAGGDLHRKNKHFVSSSHRRADPLNHCFKKMLFIYVYIYIYNI